MLKRNREFWAAIIAIIIISFLYLFVVYYTGSIPAAGEFFGHSLGILGFLLMLLTETLYSLRKRSRTAKWGPMSAWLSVHIFMGIVGPYLVLLHTSWKFNGIAGVLMLLTAIVVLSGFIGRYIYTSVPRTADGIEIESEGIDRSILLVNSQIKAWVKLQPNEANHFSNEIKDAFRTRKTQNSLVLGRLLEKWKYNRNWRLQQNEIENVKEEKIEELNKLIRKRRRLGRQVASLALTRRLLSVWHTVHIPLGMALFTVSLIHIGAAIYYSILLH